MAWVTAIVAAEQVEYRLSEHAGCFVKADGPDVVVDYRMRQETDAALVWMGSGLSGVGLVEGQALDEEGKKAARLVMNGCHPATGARLVRSEARAHPDATLPAARLVEAIEETATRRGVKPAVLLEGKPKQLWQLAAAARMVHRRGEAYRLQVDTLHRLARAAGVRLEDAYGEEELARAREHQDERVDVRVRGWDLVADLPKSISVMQALMDPQQERELRALVHQAKRETFAQLEDWIGYAVGSEDGERVRLATGGLMGWSVEHQAARPVDDAPGDPHLHVHIVIANLALCEDGKWRSIANSGQDLHRHAKAFDGLFKARVRGLLGERFGMRFEQDPRTGAWEVVGVPDELRAAFSRRAAQVDALVGAEASREDKAHVSQATRHAKHEAAGAELRTAWRRRAEDAGVDVDAMVAVAAPGPDGPAGGPAVPGPEGPRIPPPADLAAVVFHPETGLTAHDKEFSYAQLLAAVAHALPEGIGPEPQALERLAHAVLAVPGYAEPLPARGSRVMSSTDRFTTADVLAAERVIVDAARARYATGSAQLTTEQAAGALSVFEVTVGFELSREQRATVERLLTAGHGVDAVVGVAGAGKTTLMQACRIGWDATGRTYAGACLSAVAAAGLENESGIPSRTVASWLRRIEDGPGLAGVDVLVLDEAVMTDDRALAVLLEHAGTTDTKVVGIGDPQQLKAIGPGGGFAEIHRIVGGTVLTENRRQRDAGEQAALQVWRTGDRQAALRMLAEGGRVHATGTAEDARGQILAAWNAARAFWTDPHEVLEHLVVLAARNADVDHLNTGVRAIRRSAGELGPDHHYAQPGGERLTLAVGDLVRVRANDYRSRRGAGPDVLNGYRAVVTDIDSDHQVLITWRTRDPGGIGQASAWLTPEQLAGGALSLGYAMTIAASQGMTAGTSLVYGHGADAFSLYPAITRGRDANHLWLPLAALEDEQTKARLGEPCNEREQLHRAITAYATLLSQDRPDAMVSDQLRPAPEPVARQADRPTDRQARIAALREQYAGNTPRPEQQPEPEPEFPRWNNRAERRYGRLPTPRLDGQIAQATEQAQLAQSETQRIERRLAERQAQLATNPGQARAAEAAALLDQADRLAWTAQVEASKAQAAEQRVAQARRIQEAVQHSLGKSRLALRLAGTSRREQRELIARYGAEMTQAYEEAQRARQASDTARLSAWETIRESRLASTLFANQGATRYAPRSVEQVVQRLAAMREQLPEIQRRINNHVARDIDRLRRQVAEFTEHVDDHHQAIAGLQAEQELRKRMAREAPRQYRQEVDQRAVAAREAAARRAAKQARLAEQRRQQEFNRPYRPASHSRSGPSLGR